MEAPKKRVFYVDPSGTFVNPGWNIVEVQEYWFWYHPRNGCWVTVGHHSPDVLTKGVF